MPGLWRRWSGTRRIVVWPLAGKAEGGPVFRPSTARVDGGPAAGTPSLIALLVGRSLIRSARRVQCAAPAGKFLATVRILTLILVPLGADVAAEVDAGIDAGDDPGCPVERCAEFERIEVGKKLRRWLFAVRHECGAQEQRERPGGRAAGWIG